MIGRKVLVLNADYRAISVCSVAKAFLLVYLQKADMVNSVPNGFIQTVSKSFAAPSVIRLNSYVNIPYRGVMLTRQNIFKRDANQCVYCKSTKNLTLDHVVPRSQGGKTSWTNLVSACQHCNSKKSDFSLEDVGMKLPYKPFKPTFVMFLREFSRMGDENWKPFLQHA